MHRVVEPVMQRTLSVPLALTIGASVRDADPSVLKHPYPGQEIATCVRIKS